MQFNLEAIVRTTGFTLPQSLQDEERPPIHKIYSALVNDENRNALIITDVLHAIIENRSPVVLTERRQHLTDLADRLSSYIKNIFVFQGGMGTKKVSVAQRKVSEYPR